MKHKPSSALLGRRFGSLRVVRRLAADRRGHRWLCECDCGEACAPRGVDLTSGNTSSCGCGQKEAAARTCARRARHGARGTALYVTWQGMKQRCGYAPHPSYRHYGGRGIRVCAEWANDFVAFRDWAFANGYEIGLSIDRIDPNGHYEPSNCRFLTRVENSRRAGAKRMVEAFGQTRYVNEWSRETGINKNTITHRLNLGWPAELAVSAPVRVRR